MTNAQIKQHKQGNARRREEIALKAFNGPPEDRSWWAKTIGIGQASKYSMTRNFTPAKPKHTD